MGHRGRIVVTLFACTALASACSSSEPGTPTAGGGGTSASSTPPSASDPSSTVHQTSGSTAPIDNPVDLSKVKPCTLFTAQVDEVAELEQDSAAVDTDISTLPGSTGCFKANPDSNRGLAIAVAPGTGLDAFAANYPTGVEHFTVSGYPAVVITPQGVPACFAGIGMADDQMIYLRYGLADPTSSAGPPKSQLCTALHPIADQVVAKVTG